eukprot:Tbor_TRINITY_DN5301_c0_g4::TRINITY_DN5301_c0_g4_i1::g.4798::m.4798/K00861/RFK, FMN1; riboflavin kinase
MVLGDKYCWGMRGKVIHGHGRGGTMLGFPTANVELNNTTIQSLKFATDSVFYGFGLVEDSEHSNGVTHEVLPLVLSVGFNPHFKDKDLSVEVHFLHSFKGDFYGATIRFVTLGIIRKMEAYTTLEALIEQIQSDCDKTMSIIGEKGEWKSHPILVKSHDDGDEKPTLYLDVTL